jgi:hypothetical protein
MAARRMLSLSVIDTDKFVSMSGDAQALYLHLCLRADDDGFLNNSRSILGATGFHENDIKLLESNGYIIRFSSGVIVITHWRQQNTLRKDRYKETIYREEKRQLIEDENGKYLIKKEIREREAL